MHTSFLTGSESCRKALEDAGSKKLAVVYHLKIDDSVRYEQWLNASRHHVKRLYRVKADPVAREGMMLDEILIDEFSSAKKAIKFLSIFETSLKKVCSEHAILAVIPEPAITFHIVKVISWFVRLFKGVTDKGVPPATWSAENTEAWPDENQMQVARAQDLDEPLFVYNLNKYRPIAKYKEAKGGDKRISGKEAYDCYSKIAGFELLRRGAYPVYGGKPICISGNRKDSMLADSWDHFIFVRYPQRRNLLATLESDEFHKGEAHRDAGLERAAIFMAKNVK